MIDQGLMAKIVSLCKRRGFVFQSSEIYGGLKSCYDYGPLGVELKKNIAEDWWKTTVYERQNVYGMDASVLMHTDVWKASGHLDNFNDPLVDCYDCHERFRGDKAPKRAVGETVHYKVKKSPNAKAEKQEGVVGEMGYICPNCGSPRLSPGFRQSVGARFGTQHASISTLAYRNYACRSHCSLQMLKWTQGSLL